MAKLYGLVVPRRANKMWDGWDRDPSQFEIFAPSFSQPNKRAADKKWLPAIISFHNNNNNNNNNKNNNNYNIELGIRQKGWDDG